MSAPSESPLDWTRYEEPIDLANAGDSRAVLLGRIGDEPRRVLELGCSIGMMSEVMTGRGLSVTGVEIDADAAELARPHVEQIVVGDLEVTDGSGRRLLDPFVGADFDVLIAADVLEHLRDPAACLADAVRCVAPDATVYLSIPNVAHADVRLALLAGAFDYRDAGLMDKTHIQMFTLRSVVDLIRGAGLVPVDWYRVPRAIGESELDVDESLVEFGRRVFADDPDAETYQWVVTCRLATHASDHAVWPMVDSGEPVRDAVLELMNAPVERPPATPTPSPVGSLATIRGQVRRVIRVARRTLRS